MIEAARERTTVQPDGTIQVPLPSVAPGTSVEVIVLVEQERRHEISLRELRNRAKGAHGTIEEVRQHIRNLRDEWDS